MKLIDIFRPTKFIVTLFVVLSVVYFWSWVAIYYCGRIVSESDFPNRQVAGITLCSDRPPYNIFYYVASATITFSFLLIKPLLPIGYALFATGRLNDVELRSIFGVLTLVYLYLLSGIIVFVVRLISSWLKLSKSYAK